MIVDLPVPLAPTSAVFSRERISQLASRNRTRGPNRLPAFCRESIYFHFRISSAAACGGPTAVSIGGVRLRPNLDRRAHRNEIPDLVNLFIGDGDAAQRPVVEPVRRSQPA